MEKYIYEMDMVVEVTSKDWVLAGWILIGMVVVSVVGGWIVNQGKDEDDKWEI